MTPKLTYPGRLLKAEFHLLVLLQAGDQEAVESDDGGHGDAGKQGRAHGDVALASYNWSASSQTFQISNNFLVGEHQKEDLV